MKQNAIAANIPILSNLFIIFLFLLIASWRLETEIDVHIIRRTEHVEVFGVKRFVGLMSSLLCSSADGFVRNHPF